MIARSKISVSQRQLFQTASQRKLIGKKFYYSTFKKKVFKPEL